MIGILGKLLATILQLILNSVIYIIISDLKLQSIINYRLSKVSLRWCFILMFIVILVQVPMPRVLGQSHTGRVGELPGVHPCREEAAGDGSFPYLHHSSSIPLLLLPECVCAADKSPHLHKERVP